MKRARFPLLSIAGVGLLLSSCAASLSSSNDKNGEHAFETVQKGADSTTRYDIEKACTQYIEFKYLNTVTYNLFGQPTLDEPGFSDPGDNFETQIGANGGDNAGALSIEATSLSRRGYYRPADSFSYSSFEIGGEVKFRFKFHKVTSCSSMSQYEVVNCADSSLDGFSLGKAMGTGALIILKRSANSSSWTKVDLGGVSMTNLSDGQEIAYTPTSADLMQGTYYRFVSAYQYRYLLYQAVVVSERQYYDVMQRITVFLGRGGTDIKFLAEATPNQTHPIPTRLYEEKNWNGQDVHLNPSTLTSNPPLAQSKIGEFTFEGEAIKASENSFGPENDIPVYAHNGTSAEVKVHLKNLSAASALNEVTSSQQINVISRHDNLNATASSITNLNIGSGLSLLQGLHKGSEGYEWQTIAFRNDLGGSDATLKLPITNVGTYSCFRALFVKAYVDNLLTPIVESSCAYFEISVLDSTKSRFSGIYSTGSGEDAELSALAAASTLSDGATVFSSFSVEKKVSSYVLEYAFNDQPYTIIASGKRTFTEVGKYRFRVTNTFGEVAYTTIYLLALGEDNGKSQFFSQYGGFLDERMRVYEPNSYYPVYGKGVPFYLNADANWPGLYGNLKRILPSGTAEIVQSFEDLHTPLSGYFPDEGQYRLEVTVGDSKTSGDHLQYNVNFIIADSSNYTPTVNYDLLHSGIQGTSYSPKVYLVNQPSGGAGRYRFVFPYSQKGYIKAWDFAMELEALRYTETDDGYVYPEGGEIYSDLFDLFDAIKENAKKRVEAAWFNVNLATDDFEYHISSLAPIEEDLYVVSDESVYSTLVVDPVYVNGYSFVQLREYESSSVTMVSPSGREYNIPYGIDVSTFLSESGLYEVHEANWCGESVYQVLYLAPGVITAEIEMDYYSVTGSITSASRNSRGNSRITAISCCFASLVDELDPYDHIEVAYGNQKIGYLFEEIEGKIIDCNGDYTCTIFNRIGHSFTFAIRITGGKDNGDWQPHFDPYNPLTYVRGGIRL